MLFEEDAVHGGRARRVALDLSLDRRRFEIGLGLVGFERAAKRLPVALLRDVQLLAQTVDIRGRSPFAACGSGRAVPWPRRASSSARGLVQEARSTAR